MRAYPGIIAVVLLTAACNDPVSTSRYDGPATTAPSTTISIDEVLTFDLLN